jgi:hypothetical protein
MGIDPTTGKPYPPVEILRSTDYWRATRWFVSRVESQCPRERHGSAQPSTLNPRPSTLLKKPDPLRVCYRRATLERSVSKAIPVRVNDVDAKGSNSAAFCFLFDLVQVGLQVVGRYGLVRAVRARLEVPEEPFDGRLMVGAACSRAIVCQRRAAAASIRPCP